MSKRPPASLEVYFVGSGIVPEAIVGGWTVGCGPAVRRARRRAGIRDLYWGASLKLPPRAGNTCTVSYARDNQGRPLIKLSGTVDANTAPPELLASLGRHFNLMSRAAALGATLPRAEQELIRYRESVVADLEAAVGRIGRFLEEQIERQ